MSSSAFRIESESDNDHSPQESSTDLKCLRLLPKEKGDLQESAIVVFPALMGGWQLRCDNAKPKCDNCQARTVECTYTTRLKQARPSNARIQRLEEENARLRRSLRSQSLVSDYQPQSDSPHPSDVPVPTLHRENDVSDMNYEGSQNSTPLRETMASSHPVASSGPSQTDPFHGPSSVVFEPRRHGGMWNGTMKPPDPAVKNQLLAEATRQRQLENINQLLSNYWNRQHYAGSVVYRPAFMRDMASNGPYFSELLLNAILFAGSKYSFNPAAQSRPGDQDSTGRSFRNRFEEILHATGSRVLFKSNVTTIQALLIVADALFSWCDERSLSWHYMGIAISMIIDLGIHVDSSAQGLSTKATQEDVEVHRRVFWAAFALDKVQSIYQGRPARLREADNCVPIQFLDEYEELQEFNTVTYSERPGQLGCPTYSVSTFEQLCKLSIIMDRILCNLYAERSSERAARDLLITSTTLHEELRRWKSELPAHLLVNLDDPKSSTILPHTLSLLAMYNSLIILLHRPFVSDGHLQSASESAARDAFSHCATAALEIHRMLQLYRRHFCLKSVPYFISYATYVSATIHVRMAAQKEPGSGAHQCLRSCLEVLTEHQAKCHAPRRTMKILLSIMQRLRVDVGDFSTLVSSDCQIDINEPTGLGINPLRQNDAIQEIPGSASIPENDLPNDYQIDFDLMLTDFNIDEIMKSFDFTPNEPTQQTQHLVPPAQIQPLSPSSSGLDAPNIMPDIVQGRDGVLRDYDNIPFPDSLFGFDFDISA
ncbi:hypothetical protein NM208_g3465 [Fusarium decemcellulare]|uniref:Uncharacterized protein n=1 Tax=Fusarium decemcellulare TaxID=57161 RepID=A0ACC1SNX1_9HYPO|nr:hypothetical protein NM208_g3465 [Fusarium decemcellulare]